MDGRPHAQELAIIVHGKKSLRLRGALFVYIPVIGVGDGATDGIGDGVGVGTAANSTFASAASLRVSGESSVYEIAII